MKLEGEFIPQHTPSQHEKESRPSSSQQVKTFFAEYPPRKVGLLSAYCPNPENVSFINQDHDEIIVLFLRSHFIVNFFWIVGSVTALILPLIISPFLLNILAFLSPFPTIIFTGVTLYYLLIFGFMILRFTLWYFHVTFVTNKRIVDIDIVNLLNKNVAETYIRSILDVSYTQKGIMASLLNFGDLHFQTEALEQKFELATVPNPAQVSRLVSEMAEEQKGEGEEDESK